MCILFSWRGSMNQCVLKMVNAQNNRQNPIIMSGNGQDYDEGQKTLQFYQIKLMEKEREIEDHAAKLKKIQFKNNRDLKELKMAEEKAKNQLKQEKIKLDKANKALAEATEQNNVLHHRLAELKDDKDKEIESTRAQYNHLKTEVRAYERILPTHTFMSKMGAAYDQLPTYQEIFMNWKERAERYDEIDEKFKRYKTESQEKMEVQLRVTENDQKKKAELEKQLREDISKMLDLESQITTISIERDEACNKLHDLNEQLYHANQMNAELTQETQALQQKIEQFARIYHAQLQAKQQQIQKITEQQFRKYEDEIERITRNYEMKQNSHLQQLAYFEEEEHRLNEKIQKDKEKFEDSYREMYNEVQRIKRELDTEKEQHWHQKEQISKVQKELGSKENEYLQLLQKLGENQAKMETMVAENMKLKDRLTESSSESNEKYGSMLLEKKELEQRIEQLIFQINELREETAFKQNEIRQLNSQVDELKNKSGSTINQNFLQYNGMDDGVNSIRSRSGTEDYNEIQKIPTRRETVEFRRRQDSLASETSTRRKVSAMYFSQQQVEAKMAETLQSAEKQWNSKLEKLVQSKQLSEEQLKDNHRKYVDQITKQHKTEANEWRKKQEELQNKLKKLSEENELEKVKLNENINKITRKYEIVKSEKQLHEQTYIQQVNESKKDKEAINIIKAQNREQEKANKQLQRQIQTLTSQVEAGKKYQQRVQAKQSKQKSANQASQLNMKEVVEKYTSQINKAMTENTELIKAKHDLETEINYLRKNIEMKEKQIEELKANNEEKAREIDMLQDLLDHERKDRTLRTVPSLARLNDDLQGKEEENFKEFYNQAGLKEGQIMLLEREVSDLKLEIEELREKQEHKLSSLEEEMNGYIHEIIEMKLKVANAQMKASEKSYLYNQLKKKYNIK